MMSFATEVKTHRSLLHCFHAILEWASLVPEDSPQNHIHKANPEFFFGRGRGPLDAYAPENLMDFIFSSNIQRK